VKEEDVEDTKLMTSWWRWRQLKWRQQKRHGSQDYFKRRCGRTWRRAGTACFWRHTVPTKIRRRHECYV